MEGLSQNWLWALRNGEYARHGHADAAAAANHPEAASKIEIAAREKGYGTTMEMHGKVRDMRSRSCEPCGAAQGTKARPW
jgi:hypothetical protein